MNIKYFYKKTIYLLCAVLAIATACTDTRIIPPGTEPNSDEVLLMLNLQGLFGPENTPKTYALNDIGDQPGTGAENTVNDVTVFIFNAATGACEKIMQGVSPTYNPVGPELVTSGSKNIVAVVNSAANFASFYGPGDVGLVNYTGLKRMLTDAITVLPASPFLMTGEINAYLQPSMPATNPNLVTIEVKRAVAKVKIYVTKDLRASGHTLTLQSITLYQGARQVSIIENAPSATILYDVTETKSSFVQYPSLTPSADIPQKAPGAYNVGTFCMLADTFYTFETFANLDKTKAVYFDFAVAVNSLSNIRHCQVYLAENPLSGTTDTVYDVYRNNWYNLYVNIIDPGLDSVYVKVIAEPWNVADTITVIPGAGYEAKIPEDITTRNSQSIPFKLVKYYTAADMAKDAQMMAIDTHSQGASWIDLKVTDDTPWSLKFNGSPANAGAVISADTGVTWVSTGITGIGDNEVHRIYIYRPYVENGELQDGPAVELTVDGTLMRTFVVQKRDSLIFPTNSFVLRPNAFSTPTSLSEAYIPLKPMYDFWENFLLANGDQVVPAGTPTAALVWTDAANVIQSSSLSIINGSDRLNSYIYAAAGSVQGNAVIAVKFGGVTGVTYWSYHLWVTEYSPYEPAGMILYTGASTPNVFMDRNLGAMDTLYVAATPSAKGLFYQYGRKDPFSSSSIPLSVMAQPTYATALRPLEAIPFLIQNPNTFITGAFNSHTQEELNIWSTAVAGGNKTAYDPCPEGYRVPQQTAYGVSASPWNNASFTTGTGDFAEGSYNNILKYYPYGYVDETSGAFNYTAGYYWTSYSQSAAITNAVAGTSWGEIPKARGAFVRCTVDKNYLERRLGNKFGRYAADILGNL